MVRCDTPSAALAARNSSTARPSVRCPRADAHRSGRPESGAQRSVGQAPKTISSAPCWRGVGAVRPQDVVAQRSASAASCVIGWRGRIRTFNPLIQSQVPYHLATRQRPGHSTASLARHLPGCPQRTASARLRAAHACRRSIFHQKFVATGDHRSRPQIRAFDGRLRRPMNDSTAEGSPSSPARSFAGPMIRPTKGRPGTGPDAASAAPKAVRPPSRPRLQRICNLTPLPGVSEPPL
jgi:hypothetical protein